MTQSPSSPTPAPIHLGWSHISTTPDKPVQLHGQLYERVSTHVNDPCTATALALESKPADGAPEQAILLSCDIANMDPAVMAQLRERVGRRLPGFDPQKLALGCTHTHTGPVATEGLYNEPAEGVIKPAEYAAFLIEQLETAAVAAWNSRKPGRISHAVGQAALGFNRRVVYKNGTARMYGPTDTPDFKELEGASDPQVEILFTYDAQGTLSGIVACPACPAQVVEGQRFVSADFWGVARGLLREQFGEHVQVLGLTGAAGDLSPRDLVRRGRGEPSMRELEGMREMGRRLSRAIIDAHGHSQSEPQHEIVFRHRHATLSLPTRQFTQAEADEAQARLDGLLAADPNAATSKGTDGRWIDRCHKALDRFRNQSPSDRYEADVNFIRLGDVALATNPFELFLDYSFQIKARSKAHQTFVVQLANGRGAYLPTEKAIAGGSYSAMIYDNTCGPEGGAVLVEQTVEAINSLWA